MDDLQSTAATGSGGSNSGSSWVLSIQDAIEYRILQFEQARAESELEKPKCTIFRIPKRVPDRLVDESKTYTPESISLGLFHRPGRYNAPIAGELFKLKMASAFLATLRMATNPLLQPQLGDLVGSRRPHGDDAAKPLPNSDSNIRSNPNPNSSTNFNSNPNLNNKSQSNLNSSSNFKTMEDRSGAKLEGRGERASAQARDAEEGTVGLREKGWTDFCSEVAGGDSELRVIKQLYELLDDDQLAAEEFDDVLKCALSLDAVAMATGLGVFYLKKEFKFPLFLEYLDCGGDQGRPSSAVLKFHVDFLKLENQIPLCLLQRVMRILHNEQPVGGGEGGHSEGDRVLSRVCAELAIDFSRRFLPGYDNPQTEPCIRRLQRSGRFVNCDHVLDCISLVMRVGIEGRVGGQKEQGSGGQSPGSRLPSWVGPQVGRLRGRWFSFARRAKERIKDNSVKNRNFNIPSATRLHEAGIDFRNRAGFHESDLLPVFEPGWFKATLYIPQIPRLSMLTVTLWKNLLAYESRGVLVEKRLESQFFAFLAFMGCLIDTKDDVLLMTRGRNPVLPDRHSTAPQDLARVFNTILIGYPVPDYPRWLDLKHQIVQYHNQNWRRMVLDFIRTNFGKPWLIISVAAACVLLVLTFLQTIYTMLAYYP